MEKGLRNLFRNLGWGVVLFNEPGTTNTTTLKDSHQAVFISPFLSQQRCTAGSPYSLCDVIQASRQQSSVTQKCFRHEMSTAADVYTLPESECVCIQASSEVRRCLCRVKVSNATVHEKLRECQRGISCSQSLACQYLSFCETPKWLHGLENATTASTLGGNSEILVKYQF